MEIFQLYLLAYMLITHCTAAVTPFAPRDLDPNSGWISSVARDHTTCIKDGSADEKPPFHLVRTGGGKNKCQRITKDAHRNTKIYFSNEPKAPRRVRLFYDANCKDLAYVIKAKRGGGVEYHGKRSDTPLSAKGSDEGAFCVPMEMDRSDTKGLIVG